VNASTARWLYGTIASSKVADPPPYLKSSPMASVPPPVIDSTILYPDELIRCTKVFIFITLSYYSESFLKLLLFFSLTTLIPQNLPYI
jgi:hypothetical protein